MKVYIVMENTFDGVWYYDEIVKVFANAKMAEKYIEGKSGDYRIHEHEIE